jgi:phage/plasmid-associated DNA primase
MSLINQEIDTQLAIDAQEIIDFCNKHDIEWFPIILEYSETDKKFENGEIKMNKKMVKMGSHELYEHDKVNKETNEVYKSYIPEPTDFNQLSKEQIIKRQNLLKEPFWKERCNSIAINTKNIYHIDLDCIEYLEIYTELLKKYPYYKSSTKSFGAHIFIKPETTYPPEKGYLKNTRMLSKKKTEVELLSGLWGWCPINSVVYNSNCEDLSFDIDPYIIKDNIEKVENEKVENEKVEKVETHRVEKPRTKNSKEVMQRLIDMLKYDKHTADDYRTEFFRICDAMKANGFTEKDWKEFYTKSGNMQDDTEKQNLFQKCRGTTDISYIKRIAKRNNPTSYHLWLLETQRIINLNILRKGEKDVAKFISPSLKRNLILCNEEWWTQDETTGLWRKLKDPTYTVIDCIQEYINEATFLIEYKISRLKKVDVPQEQDADKLKELDGERASLYREYRNVSKSSYSSQVIRNLKELLVNNKFVENLDVLTGRLAFQNGVVDLKTKKFREGIQYDDFITKTIPFDYTESDHVYLKKELKKIMNNNDEHLEYFLSLLGYSFTAEASIEKDIYFMIDKTDGGRGDNGKTFFFNILNTVLPNYVYRSNATLLSSKNTKVHKQITSIKGKRLVYLEELPKEDDLNCKLIKELADGTFYENEIMFGTTETIKITSKFFALSNHIPKIDPDEQAVYNRYKQVSFNSHFDRTGTRKVEDPEKLLFIADKDLTQKIVDTKRDEVVSIIIEYANKFYLRKLPKIPDQFIADTEETKNTNDEFGIWAKKFLKFSTTGKIGKLIMMEKSSLSLKDCTTGMKRLGIKYNKDLKNNWKTEHGLPIKGGWTGMKFKSVEELKLEYPEEDFEMDDTEKDEI